VLYLWIQVCVYVSYYDNYFCFCFSIKWFHTKYCIVGIWYIHILTRNILLYPKKKKIVCFGVLLVDYILYTNYQLYILYVVWCWKKSNKSCFIWQKCIYSFSYRALYNLQISYKNLYRYSTSLCWFLEVN